MTSSGNISCDNLTLIKSTRVDDVAFLYELYISALRSHGVVGSKFKVAPDFSVAAIREELTADSRI